MEAAVNKKVIDINLPYRDFIRGRIMLAMLEVILKVNSCREEEE